MGDGVVGVVAVCGTDVGVDVDAESVVADGVDPAYDLISGDGCVDVGSAEGVGVGVVGLDVSEDSFDCVHFVGKGEFGESVAIAEQTGVYTFEGVLSVGCAEFIVDLLIVEHALIVVAEAIAYTAY